MEAFSRLFPLTNHVVQCISYGKPKVSKKTTSCITHKTLKQTQGIHHRQIVKTVFVLRMMKKNICTNKNIAFLDTKYYHRNVQVSYTLITIICYNTETRTSQLPWTGFYRKQQPHQCHCVCINLYKDIVCVLIYISYELRLHLVLILNINYLKKRVGR